MKAQEILIGSMEAISRANKDLSEYLIASAKLTEATIQAAVMAERERCARIAEIEHMTPRDIARVIRSNYPSD
jgi:hypothetical protein